MARRLVTRVHILSNPDKNLVGYAVAHPVYPFWDPGDLALQPGAEGKGYNRIYFSTDAGYPAKKNHTGQTIDQYLNDMHERGLVCGLSTIELDEEDPDL